jgi:Fungal specific transcription factor domain
LRNQIGPAFDDCATTGWDIASYSYDPSEPFLEETVLDTKHCFVPDDEVEEVCRFSQLGNSASSLTRSRSQYPDLAMIAPSPVASPLLEFCAPVFEEFSDKTNRRALVDHFCNVLSHLIVFKENTGNPFRQLVLPMSRPGSPVLNAIFALSSAHLEYRGVLNEEKSPYFHSQALQGLSKLLDQGGKANREEVLGAIMLLIYYEVVSI